MLEEMLRGGSRGIVGFDPTTIPGCTVWFDAADPATFGLSGTSLQTWRSKGSATCTATYKYNAPSVSTISGLSSIYFNGVSTMMTTNSIASYGAIETTWITCATNFRAIADTASSVVIATISGSAGGERSIRFDPNATAYSVNTSVFRGSSGDNTNGIRGFIDTAAYFATFTNGAMVTSNTTAVTFQAGVNQGFQIGQWGTWLNGYVYEILIYNRALSLGEYQSVEGYLSQKWGFSPAKVFTPLSILGCSIWFDAADMSSLTTSGTNITSWKNKGSIPLVAYPLTGGLGTPVGGGTNSNAYGGFLTTGASINGLNAVNCPQQTTYGMSSTVTFPTQARAVFAVYRAASAGAAPYITFFGCLTVVPNNQNGMANYVQYDGQGPVLFAEVGSGAGSILGGGSPAGTFPVNTTGMIGWVQSAISTGSNFVTMNGVPQSITTNQLATTYVTTPQYYFIGSAYTQAYTFCEYIMFNSEISISQRQAVEGYLAWKWGIQGSLGATHPNYLTTGNFVKSLTLATTHPFYSQIPQTRAFTPIDIPGCALWLDGADSATISGNVTSIREKANNVSFSVSGTVTTTTIGSQSSLSFGGAGYLFGNINNILTGTSFVVFRTTAANNSYSPFFTWRDNVVNAGQANFPAFGYLPGGNLIGPYTTWVGVGTPTTSVSIGNSYITSYSWSGTTTNVGFNGATPTSGTQPAFAHSETLLWIAFDNVNYTTVNIGEILIYNTVLSAGQRQAVEGYLANKWELKPQLPAFVNPRSIPSCAMWLDGSDPAGTGVAPANNSAIATWVDKSGNGCNATASSTNPTFLSNQYNGYGLINFGGGVYFSNATFNYNLPNRTLFIVCSSTVAGYTGFLSFNNTSGTDYSASNTMNYSSPGTNSLQIAAALSATGGGFNVFFGTGSTTQFAIYGDTFSGTTESYFMNGSNMGSTTTSTTFGASTSIYIGARQLGGFTGTYSITGTISELIIYNYEITSSQRQQVEGYLAWKWGLQAQLPATHPFYAAAPLPHSFNKVPPTIRQPALYYDVAPGNWARDWQPYLQALTKANSGATATFSSSSVTGTFNGYYGGVLAPNGNIYCIHLGTSIGVIDPVLNSITSFVTTTSSYAGGVLAPNGKIYCIPFNATSICVIDTSTNTTTTFGSVTGTGAGSLAYDGGVLAPNGNIYAIPRNATSVGVINPVANTFTTFGTTPGTNAYIGGVLAPNGKIYCIPYSATSVGVIDPVANTFTSFGTAPGSTAYVGGVLAPNGKIYCIPFSATSVGVIDPVANTFSSVSVSGTAPGGGAYSGGALAPNGKIYCLSHNSGNIGIIDPVANTFTTFGTAPTGQAYLGAVLAPNGNIYCIPYGTTSVGVISFSGISQTPTKSYCLSAYTNKF